ncbi:acyl-CoA thioesterase [Haloarcula onubensis]|uniref:Acyl-CoA thioesterase n=1 Tax=Haloarcula onubensis TaxID=2950539 RepID=A0ABU2FJF8_9EURY|nr:thioesterase family protein [Halomicroarcula sp. S3CR25-11]MDS0280895.1 acyl-CoA thioesterase [Halomicroarcula sp. S3CR25-11]
MNFETEVPLRYDDLDTYGHVNNVRYGTYIEEARIDYLAAVVGDGSRSFLSDDETGIVVKTLEIEFEQPVTPTDSVTVSVRIPSLGTTSFPMEYEVRDDGAVAATGESVVVTYDRETGEPQPIPERWRDAISQFEFGQ